MLPHPPKVLDQGSVSSCVAHGVAEALSTGLYNTYGRDIDLSVLLIYVHRSRTSRDPDDL